MNEYRIETWDTKVWLMPRRYHWRIRAKNGRIIQSSTSQQYSNAIDRDTSAWNFYDAMLEGRVLAPDVKRPVKIPDLSLIG